MLDDIKKHNEQEFKHIGSGTYCDAFKFYYNKDKCPLLNCKSSVNNSQECLQCDIYPKSDYYVIKEIQHTARYTKPDFDCEIINQKVASAYMPDLVVNIYENWTDVLETDENGIVIGKLGNKPKATNATCIEPYSYITMEYMNYKDLYLNYKAGNVNVSWSKPINMTGLLFICLVILYNLHCKLSICHGDFRDTNIFLKYVGPEYKQKVNFVLNDKQMDFDVDTGGFHIKIGDFGLSETLCFNTKSFIFRDYEFMENIYKNRECWKWMLDKTEYEKLIIFLRNNFVKNINKRIVYYNYVPEHSKSRTDFWYAKHAVSAKSSFLYEYPRQLLDVFISEFYSDK